MRIKDLFENRHQNFDEFVDSEKGLLYNLAEDLIYYMNNDDDTYRTFEISSRKNQKTDLLNWLSYLKNSDCYMVGFNNLGFDYPIIHDLMNSPYVM